MTEFDHPGPGDGVDCRRAAVHVQDRAAALPDGAWMSPAGLHHPAAGAALPRPAPSWTRAAPEPGRLLHRPRRFGQQPGAAAERHRPQLKGGGRRRREDREGPGHRRADRHPAPLDPLRQARVFGREARPRADRYRRTLELFRDYVASGITAVGPGADEDAIRRTACHESGMNCRCGWRSRTELGSEGPIAEQQRDIREVAGTPCGRWIRCSGSSASRRFWTAGCSPAAPCGGRGG